MKLPTQLTAMAFACSVIVACGFGVEPPVSRVRIGRSNHTEIFPISSGAHDGADCDACHGEFSTFTQFSCVRACHEHAATVCVPEHSGIPGFVYDDTSCYGCHPDGARLSREAHQLNFPITGSPHGAVSCADCHPNGYTSFDCINCHAHTCAEIAGRHDDVSGYQCSSIACKNCHPDGISHGD